MNRDNSFASRVTGSAIKDAFDYARDYDFSRPFFKQFEELYSVVPQQAAQHSKSENCDYTNQSQCNKDCYLVVASNYSRDCLYGMWFQHCEDCTDCLYLERSQLCYEVLNGTNCFECSHSENLENCSNVHFSKNCIGCKHCVGCVNLRNKEYYFFNKKCAKGEYFDKAKQLGLNSYSGTLAAEEHFRKHLQSYPQKYYVGSQIEDSTGDYLQNVRDARDSYNCRHCEYIKHCRDAWQARNCYDLVETLDNDFCLELEGCWDNTDCAFSMKLNQTNDVWYSSHCFSARDLFGCVGLRHKQYCILNKQYSKDDYTALRAKIVEQMKSSAEFGEHFPIKLSPFGYNETVAQEYFPLTQSEALSRGWRWKDETTTASADLEYQIPDAIEDVSADITSVVLPCKESAKGYRILKQELEFYQKLGLPVPRLCPDVRHKQRMNRRAKRALHKIKCSNCQIALVSTLSPERSDNICCEKCYLQAVD